MLPTCVGAYKPTFSVDTMEPITIQNKPSNSTLIPYHPMLWLRMDRDIRVALAYSETAMKVPMDSTRSTNAETIIEKASPASHEGKPC